MNRFILAAALAAATAVPAVAADNVRFVIDELNMSADTSSDLISVGPNGPVLGTTVSSRGDRRPGKPAYRRGRHRSTTPSARHASTRVRKRSSRTVKYWAP